MLNALCLVLIIAFTMFGCGKAPEKIQGLNGNQGLPGTNGTDGANGAPGLAGANGHSIIANTAPIAPSCSAGGYTLLIATDMNDNQVIDSGDLVSSAEICHGQPGANGAPGADAPPTPFSPVGIENPCGDAPGVYDEVFLRLSNGLLLASFSDNANGLNTRFSILVPGTYQTTDNDHCTFTVTASYQIINESHHN